MQAAGGARARGRWFEEVSRKGEGWRGRRREKGAASAGGGVKRGKGREVVWGLGAQHAHNAGRHAVFLFQKRNRRTRGEEAEEDTEGTSKSLFLGNPNPWGVTTH